MVARAASLCRRASLATESSSRGGLALIGSPRRYRPRSAASSAALEYRRPQSFSRHFATIVLRSPRRLVLTIDSDRGSTSFTTRATS